MRPVYLKGCLETHRDRSLMAEIVVGGSVHERERSKGGALRCQRRRKNLPLGRSKSRPLGAAPWVVMPSNSKHVPRRVGRQANQMMISFWGGGICFGWGGNSRHSSPGYSHDGSAGPARHLSGVLCSAPEIMVNPRHFGDKWSRKRPGFFQGFGSSDCRNSPASIRRSRGARS